MSQSSHLVAMYGDGTGFGVFRVLDDDDDGNDDGCGS